jgi:superfamily II DNA/RNA helicase
MQLLRRRTALALVLTLLSKADDFDAFTLGDEAIVRRNRDGRSCSNYDFPLHSTTSEISSSSSGDVSARAALQRTAEHLRRLQAKPPQLQPDDPQDPLSLEREKLYAEYVLQSANTLKDMLKQRRLSNKGRKPDLARRLVAYELQKQYGGDENGFLASKAGSSYNEDKMVGATPNRESRPEGDKDDFASTPFSFAGLRLSAAASRALRRAGFSRPTPIQQASLSSLAKGDSLILHAETGSGKTIAYLLPITELLWKTLHEDSTDDQRFAVLLPTRELAAQVAGVAMELAPPGSVRLVTHPVNLARLQPQQEDSSTLPRLLIASAKTFMVSLYGDDQMPAPPTTKPEAVEVLKSIRVCVLDEVDRLLGVGAGGSSGGGGPMTSSSVGSRGTKRGASNKQHEKPAAIVTAAIARHTLGRAQIVAASATVGRPLRRELARVLGLLPQECPRIVRTDGASDDDEAESVDDIRQESNDRDIIDDEPAASIKPVTGHVGRAVTIPPTVKHYAVTVSGSSDGDLLTGAFGVIKSLNAARASCRILLVLSRGFGISTKNAIGALKHFQCEPPPLSLLDALEADSTLDMIEKHRDVSGAAGVGQSSYFDPSNDSPSRGQGYLLVTGEDTVRGLHLDGLEVVIVVGRARGPDEYCHIAGRTGRAGRSGNVINVVSEGNGAALSSWEKMLDCEFMKLSAEDAGEIFQQS